MRNICMWCQVFPYCFMVQNIPIIIFPVQSDRDLVLLCCMTDVRGRWTSFDSSAYIMSDRIRSHLGAEQGVRLQTLKLECFWIPDKVHVFCIFTFYFYLQYNDCERMNMQYFKVHFYRLQRWKITFYLGVLHRVVVWMISILFPGEWASKTSRRAWKCCLNNVFKP